MKTDPEVEKRCGTVKNGARLLIKVFLYNYSEFHNGNCNLPIFERSTARLYARPIVEQLLDRNLNMAKVATVRPVSVQENLTFVVDTGKLDSPEDIRADDLGTWLCNGKHLCYCTLSPTGRVDEILTRKPSKSPATYGLVRRYYTHGTAPDLRKTVAELIGKTVVT